MRQLKRVSQLGGEAGKIGRGDRQALAPLAGESGAIAEQAFGADPHGVGNGRIGLLGAEGNRVLVQGGKAQPQRLVPLGLRPGGGALAQGRAVGRSLRRRLVLRGFVPEGRAAGLCGHGFSCVGGRPDRRGCTRAKGAGRSLNLLTR
jgi:hypothetical protein